MSSVTPPILLTSAVLAALLAALVNLWLARRKSHEEERARVRAVFAEAFAVAAGYKEYPYAIRRRDIAKPGEERVRLSEQIRQTQERLSYYLAWTKAESPRVGEAYAALTRQLRLSAGGAMREAWLTPAIADDASMNVPPSLVDLIDIEPFETRYLDAVTEHLRRITPWRLAQWNVRRTLRDSIGNLWALIRSLAGRQ